ncbi:hypothetical protein [Pinibacter aurantiacus]|uniref:Uncharacterized protein n=1 Tax=Pinibacter aurantiacus TaxID=2851599 RepID=A0A9E2S593_9BACT|nr:hypothetical protein [Pinibacter aurantiacus]MBV4355513.1 hypothetical protein [Pinibacter aurantiacus]
MLSSLANEFSEISEVLSKNKLLRASVINLIDSDAIPGKVTEEKERLSSFKNILKAFVNGSVDLSQAINLVETDLPRENSKYSNNNRVFANGWAERLVRIQVSRFYNQAVMKEMLAQGHKECFIPHSSAEEETSECSTKIAGSNYDLATLYSRLIDSYSNGNFINELKIPNHPHCTHVVRPVN